MNVKDTGSATNAGPPKGVGGAAAGAAAGGGATADGPRISVYCTLLYCTISFLRGARKRLGGTNRVCDHLPKLTGV